MTTANPKIAVVVGVGPGIGKSVSLKFAKEGYVVALMARNKDKLEAIQQEIEKNGGKVSNIVDLTTVGTCSSNGRFF